ncbi:MAG: DUF305 domain-containing protein [Caulobacteraceae bacterium]|nr:DUF305 domain-containing protein [Caulobacteraceae bacterium]
MKRLTIAAAAAALFAVPALAQQGANHAAMAKQDYMKSMQDMHQAMMKADDRDPDRAFALKMIEHHRGGVAMSQVVLKHGDDPEIKRMAQKTMEMQQKEIGELQSWLDRHGGRAPRP